MEDWEKELRERLNNELSEGSDILKDNLSNMEIEKNLDMDLDMLVQINRVKLK